MDQELFARYIAQLQAAMERGHREYGDTSFSRPVSRSLEEIQEELVDVAGWGFIAWLRIERLKSEIQEREGKYGNTEQRDSAAVLGDTGGA